MKKKNYQYGEENTDLTGIKRIMLPYANKFDNMNDMDKFLKTQIIKSHTRRNRKYKLPHRYYRNRIFSKTK